MAKATTPGSSSPSDVPSVNERSIIRQGLNSALGAIKATGTFAAFAKVPSGSIKPIFIDNVGFLEFPLLEATARALIAKARQESNGKGNHVYVDDSARNIWELDADHLHLSPQWAVVADSSLEWVARKLGIPGSISIKAQFQEIVIHEKEAICKAHANARNIPGLFGTLVVCLPSEHRGGDLVLKHENSTKVFKTSNTHPSMACWFSDVTSEVLPVTSGLRIVLVYNLVTSEQPDEPRLSATLNAWQLEQVTRVQEALRAWLDSRGPQRGAGTATVAQELDYLCYALHDDCTRINPALDKLKGSDFHRMQCLQDTCSSQKATMFLAILEKTEYGKVESPHRRSRCVHDHYWEDDLSYEDDGLSWHEIYDVEETEYRIKNVVSVEGKAVREECIGEECISEEDFQSKLIQYDKGDDPFLSADNVEEDHYSGSREESDSATHYYRISVAVIVPNDLVDVFLTGKIPSDAAQGQLPKYLARCSELDPQSRQSAMNMVRHLAELALSTRRTASSFKGLNVNEETVMEVVNVILQNRNYELFCLVFSWLKGRVGTQFLAAVKKAMDEDQSFDFSQVKDSEPMPSIFDT
ncbi:hypothetical protein QBC37DRAFT_92808 [Rhypophila decipiens]|uniref:Uncharacterized protein n=1 Tax=Rhypophila decipiens TaxID=261697 RepID=A0AAN6XV70_9PEZI|nr:hypothetical protein QBC37DRAFT_92808 [Rhypophila decipiens]